MVLGLELFISLFNNLAIFIALATLYRYFFRHELTRGWLRRQLVLGIIFGIFAVVCMYAKIPVSPGVIVDQRNTIVALSGVFGGGLSALVSALFAGFYRLHLGGEGAVAGFIGVFLAASSGILLNQLKSFSSIHKAILGSFVATVIILPGFLFYKDIQTGLSLMYAMALPYGLAIMSGIFLVGLLLHREESNYDLEQSFRKTEKMYRELVEKTEDLVTQVDSEGNYTFVNEISSRVLGMSPEECIGTSAFENLHPDDREKTLAWFQACADNRDRQGMIENRLVNSRTGVVTDIMWSSSFYYDDAGRVTGVGGIGRDITSQKQAVRTIRGEAVRRKVLMDTAQDGIVLIDQHHRVMESNQSFADMLGYSVEEVLKLHTWDWEAMHTEEDIRKGFANLNAIRMTFETMHRRKDGSTYDAEVSASGMMIEGESMVLCIVRDITERKNTQEFLMQSEKMMSIGGVAAGIAHEINNPLAAISGGTQNLKRRLFEKRAVNLRASEECGVPFEAIQHYARNRNLSEIINGILDAAHRASAIVKHLLDFSRKSENAYLPNDLSRLLDETVALASSDYDLKKHFDFRTIEIERRYQDKVSCVCEANQIKQVFFNILKNAAQAMGEKKYGEETPKFLFTIREKDDNVVVEIEDNGPGIDELARKRLFEPFYTTKAQGQGTGLGLSISYFIITSQHNGKLEVLSEPGQWTRFVITLPKAAPETGIPVPPPTS